MTSEGNGPVENHSVANKSLKRPNADSDEEEDKGSIAPPIHDIYRARQQKRIRWAGPKTHRRTRTWTSRRTIEPEPTRVSQLAGAVLTPASSLVYCEPALLQRRSRRTRPKRVDSCFRGLSDSSLEITSPSLTRHRWSRFGSVLSKFFFFLTVLFFKTGWFIL